MSLICRNIGMTDYKKTLKAMQVFTQNRHAVTPDELWLTEHDSVYTLGLNRKNVRLPANQIAVVEVDRGGKITYHGLGQVVIYTLIDLKRRNLNVRQLVSLLEASMIETLADVGVEAYAKHDAPGVYVQNKQQEAKIGALGLRLKNQCCYHGLSLNINMDLTPFLAIDPCGYAGLAVTQTHDLDVTQNTAQIGNLLLIKLQNKLTERSL